MPRSKRVSAYPIVYHQLFDSALERGRVEIPFEDPSEAFRLRQNLYGLLNAMDYERHSQAPVYRSIKLEARKTFNTDGTVSGSKLRLINRDHTDESTYISNYLSSLNPSKKSNNSQPKEPSTSPATEARKPLSDEMTEKLAAYGYTVKTK